MKEISPLLADLPPLIPYSVPYNYFEQLPDTIRDRIVGGENAVPLPSFSSKQPFGVPSGYFEGLADSILSKIKHSQVSEALEETQLISPLVASISRTQPYTVPVGYFNRLTEEAVTRVSKPAGAKVIRMDFYKKFARYAAAAVVTGALVVTALFLMRPNRGQEQTGSVMDAISIGELENYLSTEPLEPVVNTSSLVTADLKAEDMKEFIDEFSDETLQQYLNQNKLLSVSETN